MLLNLSNNHLNNGKATIQQSCKQDSYKITTNKNKNKNKNKNNEGMYIHSLKEALLCWNSVMNKNDIITTKTKSLVGPITLTLDELIKRCQNLATIISTIKTNGLQKYVFYKIHTYDFNKFIENINIFEGDISDILDRIVKREEPYATNKIKKHIISEEIPTTSQTTTILANEQNTYSFIDEAEKAVNVMSKEIYDGLLQQFNEKIKSNKILAIYYEKGGVKHPIIKGMFYSFVLESLKQNKTEI